MIAALICGRAEHGSFPARNTFPLLGRPLMVVPVFMNSFAGAWLKTSVATDLTSVMSSTI